MIDMFIEQSNEINKFLSIATRVRNVRLLGHTGSGKSFLVHYLKNKYNWKLWEYSLCSETTRWDLIAGDILEKGSTRVRKGIVTLWLEDKPDRGYCRCKNPIIDRRDNRLYCKRCKKNIQLIILFLDEFNFCRNDVKTFINQLGDFRQSIWIPELQREYRREWYHILVIAHNPHEKTGYTATYEENIALVRRFETIVLEWLPIEEETKLLLELYDDYRYTRKLSEYAWKIRNLYRQGILSTVLTTENLKNYCIMRKLDNLSEKEIIDIVKGLFPEEERDIVDRLWETDTDRIIDQLRREGRIR